MVGDGNQDVRNSLRQEVGKFAMSPKLQLKDIERMGGQMKKKYSYVNLSPLGGVEGNGKENKNGAGISEFLAEPKKIDRKRGSDFYRELNSTTQPHYENPLPAGLSTGSVLNDESDITKKIKASRIEPKPVGNNRYKSVNIGA